MLLFHAVQPVIQFGSELQPCSSQDLAAAMGVQCNAASLPTVATMQNPKAMDTTDESTSANAQPVDSQMEDKVHFPAYLFSPPPSRLNTDHLRKLLMISEICKNYALLNVFEHLINLFGFVKRYLVDSCSGHKDDSRIYRIQTMGMLLLRLRILFRIETHKPFIFHFRI